MADRSNNSSAEKNRGISLLDVPYKIRTLILKDRLQKCNGKNPRKLYENAHDLHRLQAGVRATEEKAAKKRSMKHNK